MKAVRPRNDACTAVPLLYAVRVSSKIAICEVVPARQGISYLLFLYFMVGRILLSLSSLHLLYQSNPLYVTSSERRLIVRLSVCPFIYI